MTALLAGTVATQAQFEEQMTARLRGLLGEMLPDDVLKKIVNDGIERTFFTEKITRQAEWNRKEEREPSFIGKFLRENIESLIDKAAKSWFAENRERMDAMVKETLENNVLQSVANAFTRIWASALKNTSGDFNQRLEQIIYR